MKKIIILFTIACFSFCLTVLAQEKPQVEVLYASGTPQVCFDGEAEYVDVQEGAYLEAGDKIQTDANSYIGLGFDEAENNILKVDSNSNALLISRDNEKLELLEGRVFVIIDDLPAGSRFEVRTPTAIAGVKGTDWVVTATQDSTNVEAIDGTPYVKSFGEDGELIEDETIVLAGYETTIKRFHRPAPPVKIPLERLERRRKLKAEMRRQAQATRARRRALPRSRRRLRRQNRRLQRRIRRFP